MKHLGTKQDATKRPRSLQILGGALLPLVAAACHDHDHHHGDSGSTIPVFFEQEPNDFVDEANYFGVLFPGDSLLIEADIVDGSFVPPDPFDGFAFTAGQPIHVDFIVYVDDPFSEVELGLYDPQLAETVGYYLQDGDLVYGGVDVLSGAFDFHLVIEGLVGATTYGLEIVVYSLYESEAAGAQSATFGEISREDAEPRGLVAQGAHSSAEDARDRLYDYTNRPVHPDDDEEITIGRIHILELDETTQNVRRSTFDLTTR